MNRKEKLDQRLKDFYDRVPDIEDALPFKDYLLKHEDSRMAWYLLGKQYEAKGQEAKAAYCYAQAGEVYEAFENKAAPSPKEDLKKTRSRRGGRRWLALVGSSALLLAAGLLLFGGRANAPDDQRSQNTELEADVSLPATMTPGEDGAPTSKPFLDAGKYGFSVVAGAAEPDVEGAQLFAQLAARAGKQSSLLIRTPRIGNWIDWVRSGKPVASMAAGGSSGTAALQWHDSKWCACGTADGKPAARTVEAWKPAQEMKLLLRSAIEHYRNRTGKWPANPESLAGSYPNNNVAGWTDEMTQWFDEMKAVVDNKKDGKIPLTVGWPEKTGPAASRGKPAGQLEPLAKEAMEIIVDKTHHRLAVVSGGVLLRNYAVGLGGGRTPEGSFYISEKVRDPNGSSDGIFGSRGMTLSDTRYGIHGTDEPDSIGKDESLGCIRMAKEDIEELYDLVPMGTTVTITKGGLPSETRVPPERFRLPSTQDETNPRKVYDWLG